MDHKKEKGYKSIIPHKEQLHNMSHPMRVSIKPLFS